MSPSSSTGSSEESGHPRGRRSTSFPPPPQTRASIRAWDRRAIEEFGIPGILLMENAGGGAARVLEEMCLDAPLPGPFHIICGPGNNGGDGLVVARHLHNRGHDVRIEVAGRASHAPGSDAGVNLEIVRRMRIPLSFPDPPAGGKVFSGATVVDALFGTGLSRPLEPPFLDWVRAINASDARVIALDIPSGLDADTGQILGAAVQAHATLTFAAAKVGFLHESGPRSTGTVRVIDIGLPREIWAPGLTEPPQGPEPPGR